MLSVGAHMATELVEAMPLVLCPKDYIFFISVPRKGPLGTNDRDASKVVFAAMNSDGELNPDFKVCVVPNGKLGTLKGGLLNLADFRVPLGKDEIKQMAVESTKEKLNRKRFGLEDKHH